MLPAVLLGLLVILGAAGTERPGPRIRVTPNEAQRRVDVTIDGAPFTSYIWPVTLKKPVLFPLRSAKGTVVTRGFPLEARAGERVDHPHQVGHWFNYGNVNGLDFWNNSDAVKAEDAARMGTIVHRRIVSTKSGQQQGELEVEMDWVGPDGSVLLREHTKFVFGGDAGTRRVDRITTLTAASNKVVFTDNKEGLFGLRVARALEMPSDRAEVFTDASGRATTVAKLDNTGVTGIYLTSEGRKGDAAWGTTGRWCSLSGTVGDEPVTIAILDHPGNPGYPTYWHARGYGLFAANPLGRKAFSDAKEELNLTLEAGRSVTFRYRILIRNEKTSSEAAEAAQRAFAAAYR